MKLKKQFEAREAKIEDKHLSLTQEAEALQGKIEKGEGELEWAGEYRDDAIVSLNKLRNRLEQVQTSIKLLEDQYDWLSSVEEAIKKSKVDAPTPLPPARGIIKTGRLTPRQMKRSKPGRFKVTTFNSKKELDEAIEKAKAAKRLRDSLRNYGGRIG